jgi:hypothetical protein
MGDVFSSNYNDKNTIFNNFLNAFLRKFMLVFLKTEQLCRILKPIHAHCMGRYMDTRISLDAVVKRKKSSSLTGNELTM